MLPPVVPERSTRIGDLGFHRRRDAQGAVDAAEVVKRERASDGGPVVLPLLAEAIREPGESAGAHSDA